MPSFLVTAKQIKTEDTEDIKKDNSLIWYYKRLWTKLMVHETGPNTDRVFDTFKFFYLT